MKKHLLPSVALAALMPVMGSAQDAAVGGFDLGAALQENANFTQAAPIAVVDMKADGRLMDEVGTVPFKCPIEKIRQAYQELSDPTDTLVAITIEKQVIGICKQSQEALIKIAENEQKLGEMFGDIIAPPEPVYVEVPADPVLNPQEDPVQTQSASGAAPEITLGGSLSMLENMLEEDDEVSEPQIADITPEKVVAEPEYKVVAVMKDGDGWRALINLKSGLYSVRQGDKPDENFTVSKIENGLVEMEDQDGNVFTLE